MTSTTLSSFMSNNFSAQVVTISSSCPYQIMVERTSCTSPNAVCIYSAPSKVPTCLIESNATFTAHMRYPDRHHPETLLVVEFGGEYSCSFPLWCDAIVQVDCGTLRFVLNSSAARQEVRR